jgi:t-SNARE complex subunit (syntaxin)
LNEEAVHDMAKAVKSTARAVKTNRLSVVKK